MGSAETDPATGIDILTHHSDCSNVLLEVPSVGSVADAACIDCLTVTPPADTHVVIIALTRAPDDWLRLWQTHAGEQLPAAVDIISTDNAQQATAIREATAHHATPLTLETVAAPSALSRLSIKSTTTLHQPQHGAGDTPLRGCFRSATTLLQSVGLERAVRFLDVLTSQVAAADAVLHYHLASHAHDRRTRTTLYHLFDRVIQVDADRTVTVHE